MSIDLVRRTVLRGMAAAALVFVVRPLWAQDPRATAVQRVARAWLAITDKLDAEASWNAAGKKFQQTMKLDQWQAAMHDIRTPLGQAAQRTIVSTEFDNEFPGAPTGVYAHVEFRTSFAAKLAGETVSLEREGDGEWHVIGYSIH